MNDEDQPTPEQVYQYALLWMAVLKGYRDGEYKHAECPFKEPALRRAWEHGYRSYAYEHPGANGT